LDGLIFSRELAELGDVPLVVDDGAIVLFETNFSEEDVELFD
jgi:hypothetical protein